MGRGIDTFLRQAGGVVVVDPSEFAERALATILDGASAAGARVILCGGVFQVDARFLFAAARSLHVEIAPLDGDALHRIMIPLIDSVGQSVPSRVLRLLAATEAVGDRRVSRDIVSLFSWMPLPRNVQTWAANDRAHPTTMRERFRVASLGAPIKLLAIARASRICHFALTTEMRAADARRAVGFGSSDAMERSLRRLIGVPYRRLSATLNAEQAAERLAAKASL